LEGQASILVRVEKAYQAVAFTFSGGNVAVLSQVCDEFVRRNISRSISVNTLESSVRREISDQAKALSGALEAPLAVTYSNEERFES
jgi:hypothetical protein